MPKKAVATVNRRGEKSFEPDPAFRYVWSRSIPFYPRALLLAGETLWKGRLGWYAAVDASAFAERDGSLDWAVDLGLLLSPWPRRWRLGLQYYDGRAPLGEFIKSDQRSLTLGLWLDL